MSKDLTKYTYKSNQSVLAFCPLTGKLNAFGTTSQGAVCFQCENPLHSLITSESHVHLV